MTPAQLLAAAQEIIARWPNGEILCEAGAEILDHDGNVVAILDCRDGEIAILGGLT